MKTTLLIMAAGIGSRFGTGIKQLEPVDDSNHIIMDYFDIQLQPFEELEKAMKWKFHLHYQNNHNLNFLIYHIQFTIKT